MLSINGIYDGKRIIPTEPIPMEEGACFKVIITFLEPIEAAALATEHLSDGIQEAMALLQHAIDHYTDREQRVSALQNYRQKLEDLWKASCWRRDRFQNLVVLIKAALAMFSDLSELTQTQLATLVNVTQVLTEPIISYHTIGKCDDTLFEAGIRTSPEITNWGSALVNI